MSEALLQVQQVTKTFPTPEGGTVVALNSVDLAISEGEFFVMLGPSGCGKTSLLRCIAGLEYPDSGQIMLDGARIDDVPAYDRPVNTVFQSYALFPHMSVAQNVAFGLEMEHLPKDQVATRVAAALDQVKLTGLDRRKPSQLSGGQQQRVALARALAKEPKVLLLDEPLSALDLKLRRGMQVELKRLQRETGITFVFVTHDQEEAMTMGDRIAVFNEGTIVQTGTPQEIYRRPVNSFVADFIGETNLIKVNAAEDGLVFPGGGLLAWEFLADDCAAPTQGECLLAVRPEDFEVVESGGAVNGEVLDVVFTGGLIRVRVLAGGQEIVAALPSHGVRVPAIGQQTQLRPITKAARTVAT